MKTLLLRCAAVLVITTLAGCGLKGPLYFPADNQSVAGTTPTATQLHDASASATGRE